ncbi:nuclear transport factor 2 family protein [Streptomyces niveus]|uniref:nuclear transport factor 2 family protein n=1 Tax=Streptomyces niveus TaxID=193462 RepID=UPI00371E4AD0
MTKPPTGATADPLTVLTGMYAAEARYLTAGGPGAASFAPLAPFFSPDVVLHQADALPYGGTWRGHEGMERFFAAMSGVWESFDMVEQEFLATGETGGPAVVLTRIRARARATGRELGPVVWILPGSRSLARTLAALSSVGMAPPCLPPPPCDRPLRGGRSLIRPDPNDRP